MTRRPVKSGDLCDFHPFANGAGLAGVDCVKRSGRLLWEVGRTYGVKTSRTGKSIARIYIDCITHEKIQHISAPDCIREGFDDKIAFIKYWQKLYHNTEFDMQDIYGTLIGPSVWVLSFTFVEDSYVQPLS